MAIDVGPGATDRASRGYNEYTCIDLANPANATGNIDTFELWFGTDAGSNVVAGTMTGSGTSYTPHDSVAIGNVTAGSKQTFTGLTCDVSMGDYAAAFFNGTIERSTSGGSGVYVKLHTQWAAGTQTYGLDANYAISIYGTGTEAGGTDYPISCATEVTLSSVTNRVFDSIRATTSEITFSPTLSRAWEAIRATTSNLVTSTNLAFQRGWLITSTVGVTLNTTLDRLVSFTRATVANVSFNPSLVKSWGRTITSVVNVSLASSLNRIMTFTRAFSSGVTFLPSILSSLAKIYLVIINTGIKLATSITRKIGYTRASNTALSLNPSMVRALAYNRLSSTGIVLTSTVDKIVSFTRSTTSNISTALSINRVVNFTRNTVSNIDFLAALIATLGTSTVDYLITIVTNISVAVSVSKSWWSSFLERRFHLSPSTTYGSDTTKSDRYGVSPTTSSGSDISKSGRYGVQE